MQDAEDDDEEKDGAGGYSAKDLAGLKGLSPSICMCSITHRIAKRLMELTLVSLVCCFAVQHGSEEILDGETMILTLKDSSILDDKRQNLNDETDELENVLLAENKKRKKAKKASAKKELTNPFDEEEDKDVGGILGKYDEKEADEALVGRPARTKTDLDYIFSFWGK